MPAPAPVSHSKPMWHHSKLLSGHCISCSSVGCNFCIRPHGAVWAVILQLLQKLQGEVASPLRVPLAPVLFWPAPVRQSCVMHMFGRIACKTASAAALLFVATLTFLFFMAKSDYAPKFSSHGSCWVRSTIHLGCYCNVSIALDLVTIQAFACACSCNSNPIVCAELWSCTMCTVLLLSGWHAEAQNAYHYRQAM